MGSQQDRPIRVLQFGTGNFLRGFADYMIDIANEKGLFDGGVVLVKSTAHGTLDAFHAQDCRYMVTLRGIVEGRPTVQDRKITCVADAVGACEEYEKYLSFARLDTLRFVVSNTTEAGIVYDESDRAEMTPPVSFPAKLTQFLYERYRYFNGAADRGLIMLPVELIDDNGVLLKEYVLKHAERWNLGEGFRIWLNEACVFASTLVDRIITGYPRDEEKKLWQEWGYQDKLIVAGEPFALWVIESDRDISGEFPLDRAMEDYPGMQVIFTRDQKPYKQRKVRILNGAHTSFALASYLAGNDTVLESMQDELICGFMKATVFDEVIPTLELPERELREFAEAVIMRFRNPYVKHALLSISLNSVSKWRARCMPSLLEYTARKGELPPHLTFSLAALMAFYRGTEIRDGALIGHRGEEEYRILDESSVLEFFAGREGKDTEEFVRDFLSNTEFFGRDLTETKGLAERIVFYLDEIGEKGMRRAMEANF